MDINPIHWISGDRMQDRKTIALKGLSSITVYENGGIENNTRLFVLP